MIKTMYHSPVLLEESIESLEINENGVYVDLTFGGGGHSKEILKRLSKEGKLIAFDSDKDAEVNRIDLAIDGADEVDPDFQLIKGGGACHVQEKLVATLADRFVVVVDSTKIVDRLNLEFLLPVEVVPSACLIYLLILFS